MNTSPYSGPIAERARFYLLIAFVIVCALLGGSARADVPGLLVLRPMAVLAIAAFLLIPGKREFDAVRVPLLLLAALAAAIAVQLIPLPPGWWLSLPGHARYAEAANAIGAAQPWRPISLSPDATWNSLVALLLPLAMLVGIASIRGDQRMALIALFAALVMGSTALGILQLAVRDGFPFQPYAFWTPGAGFLANRNHQAALLACGLPLLRLWTLLPVANPRVYRMRIGLASVSAALMIVMMLVIGSRAGVALTGVGLVGAFLVAPTFGEQIRTPRMRSLVRIAAVALPVLLVVVVVVFGRAVAIDRVLDVESLDRESRINLAPVVLSITRDFLPFGTGFGSFDQVFRGFEPDSALHRQYFNHAHNDLAELAMTGGALALLVLVAFLAWWSWRAFLAIGGRPSIFRASRRLGVFVTAVLMLSSIVDYPLRAPLLALLFAAACAWMSQPRSRVS
jgi:O-antigen ligase